MATALKSQLDHFEFDFLIVLTAKILEPTHSVSKLLQNKKCDLRKSADLIHTAYNYYTNSNTFYELRKTADDTVKM